MKCFVTGYVALGALTLAACATPPATREHMLATYARQNGFKSVVVDGNEEYCSTRPHGTHQCITKAMMAASMDNTFPVAWACSGSSC